MYNIKDISHQTGLNYAYIRKCLNRLKDILEPHIQRGSSNAILIDTNGAVIFDRIRQLKEQGLAITEIKRQLEKELEAGKTDTKNELKGDIKGIETGNNEAKGYLLEEVLKLYSLLNIEKDNVKKEVDQRIKDITERENSIKELTAEKAMLAGTLKLLPEGKTPEEVKQDYEQRQRKDKEISRVLGELKSTGAFSFSRRKKLLRRLEELL